MIKVFLKKFVYVLIFLIITQMLLFGLSSLAFCLMPKKNFIVSKRCISNRKQIFIFGNSHTQYGIKEDLLPNRFINISENAEPLYYSIVKARSILEASNNDTFIMLFTNNHLCTIKWVLGDNRLLENYSKNFLKLNTYDHRFLWINNPLKCIRTVFSMSPIDLFKSKYFIYGRSSSIDPNVKFKLRNNNINALQVDTNYNKYNLKGFSLLENMIESNQNKKFIFIRMPLHNRYDFPNESLFIDCKKKIELKSNCTFIDLGHFQLNEDMFADQEHLNLKGSVFITNYLSNFLKLK